MGGLDLTTFRGGPRGHARTPAALPENVRRRIRRMHKGVILSAQSPTSSQKRLFRQRMEETMARFDDQGRAQERLMVC